MDYKELIDTMRGYSTADIISRSSDAAAAIETLMAEREAAMDKRCKICEYWIEKYQKCEHPEQFAADSEDYMAPPDKLCELYEPCT